MPRILYFAVLLGLATVVQARTIEGVELAENSSARDGTALKLHGAGVREKFVFDIYVGALYLTSRDQGLQTIMGSNQPARIEMHFLYDEVDAKKLRSSWREGFEGNNDREVLDTIEPQLEDFVRLFPTAVEGDVFSMEFLPGKGTRVVINDDAVGTIAGDVFFHALLGVFLGPEPADEDLKQGMLGGE